MVLGSRWKFVSWLRGSKLQDEARAINTLSDVALVSRADVRRLGCAGGGVGLAWDWNWNGNFQVSENNQEGQAADKFNVDVPSASGDPEMRLYVLYFV